MDIRIQQNILLNNYTTFRIGGPAKYFSVVNNKDDLIKAVEFAKSKYLPYFILGGGSNLLVSDSGFKGLVIKNEIKFIKIIKTDQKINLSRAKRLYIQTTPASKTKTLSFFDLDCQDQGEPILVQAGAGVKFPYLVNYTLKRNISGLQWFSGVPGTIGGAIYFNIHGGNRLLSDYLWKATLLDKKGKIKQADRSYFKLTYDRSILSKTKEIVLDITLRLFKDENAAEVKRIAKEWLKRKCQVQPRVNTPGCIFRNISISERRINNFKKAKIGLTPEIIVNKTIPTGWLIDKCGLKGKKIGGAGISKKHANFIVNRGGATAKDVVALISLVKETVKENYDVELEEEIEYLGF